VATTRTRSATQTGTLTKIVYVARKIQADFLAILDTYGYFSEEWGLQVMHDIRILMDEEVIDQVYLVWTRNGSNEVLDAFSYRIIAAGIGLADDRSGNIRYRPELAGAAFHLRVEYNQRWWSMPAEDKQEIKDTLALSWGPAGRLDYSAGRWESDRTYSKDGYGAQRERFVR
jgi:hypothetical protein